MAVPFVKKSVGREDDIAKALGELAKQHGLRVVCNLEQSAMASTSLMEEQHLSIKVTDVGDPELIASPRVRIKSFFAVLAGNLQRMCEDRGFRVYVATRDPTKRTSWIDIYKSEPLTVSHLWEEYVSSLELDADARKSTVVLRFIATDGAFKSKLQSTGPKLRTSDFI